MLRTFPRAGGGEPVPSVLQMRSTRRLPPQRAADGKQARATPPGSPLHPGYKNLKHSLSIGAAGDRRAALLRPSVSSSDAALHDAARTAAAARRKDTRSPMG